MISSIVAALVAFAPTEEIDQYVADQMECLALNVYHEARSQSFEGQLAVAFVTLNRVDHDKFPNSICGVVHQHKQFSWTHLIKDPHPYEDEAWAEAQIVALTALINRDADMTGGAVFYHANYVETKWAKEVDFSVEIDDHVFYTWDGEWN